MRRRWLGRRRDRVKSTLPGRRAPCATRSRRPEVGTPYGLYYTTTYPDIVLKSARVDGTDAFLREGNALYRVWAPDSSRFLRGLGRPGPVGHRGLFPPKARESRSTTHWAGRQSDYHVPEGLVRCGCRRTQPPRSRARPCRLARRSFAEGGWTRTESNSGPLPVLSPLDLFDPRLDRDQERAQVGRGGGVDAQEPRRVVAELVLVEVDGVDVPEEVAEGQQIGQVGQA